MRRSTLSPAPVPRLIRGADAVLRAVVVSVVVDGVTEGERSRHDAIEEPDPPVEHVTKSKILVVPGLV